jgi:hypothetical protein
VMETARECNGAAPAEEPPMSCQLPAKVAQQCSQETVAAQMRRRREAARRLPSLDNGHRDPLDALARARDR